MSWKGVTVMDQRVRFVSEYLKGYFPFSELCIQFSISRKTGYKWVQRYAEYGVEGLNDRGRRPHTCPHKTDGAIVEAIVQARMKHPTWGPKKLLQIISPHYQELPAVSTTADILSRKGLIAPGKRRIRRFHPGCPKTTTNEPNDIWTADYKGHFRMGNSLYCYPLTVCDMHSRYLLGCEGHNAISLDQTKRHFTRLFNELWPATENTYRQRGALCFQCHRATFHPFCLVDQTGHLSRTDRTRQTATKWKA